METKREKPLIGIVGVCASGKTTCIAKLSKMGHHCRHIAQEHSYVQTMWKQLTNPDLLVYLDVSFPQTIIRRNLNWTIEEYEEQLRRLQNARQNADIRIDTDKNSVDEICEIIDQRINELFPNK